MSTNAIQVPQRGVLTDTFIEFMQGLQDLAGNNISIWDGLATTGPGDGDHLAAGWPGEPGDGQFASYAAIKTGVATIPPDEQSRLSGQHGAWNCGYLLYSYGASRAQCDWVADQVRTTALEFPSVNKINLGQWWSAESVRFMQLGAITPNETTNPPIWSGSDQLFIRITRSRMQST